MSGQTKHLDASPCTTPPDLRAQLDELLAAFDEIARYGRERRRLQQEYAGMESTQ